VAGVAAAKMLLVQMEDLVEVDVLIIVKLYLLVPVVVIPLVHHLVKEIMVARPHSDHRIMAVEVEVLVK
jgi:hypothetical protein